MRHSSAEPLFENRYDAGRKLAEKLMSYTGGNIIVLGIPNGGVAVALSVALALDAHLDLVISRKIPLPLSPEGGFGSVTDDGTLILNDEVSINICSSFDRYWSHTFTSTGQKSFTGQK